MEYWPPARSAYASERIMGYGLRLGEDNGMMDLKNQNEYNCIDFLVILAYFLGEKQKMLVWRATS